MTLLVFLPGSLQPGEQVGVVDPPTRTNYTRSLGPGIVYADTPQEVVGQSQKGQFSRPYSEFNAKNSECINTVAKIGMFQ